MQNVSRPKAMKNFDGAGNFVADESVSKAIRVVGAVRTQVKQLRLQPSIGRVGRVVDTRELVTATVRFIVPHRISDGDVQVLRVFHTSPKLPRRW